MLSFPTNHGQISMVKNASVTERVGRLRKGVFLAGTDTEIGKTYIASLLIRQLMREGKNPCYYKVALSAGTQDDVMTASEVRYVRETTGLTEPPENLASFTYHTPVALHLAARLENNPFNIEKAVQDFQYLSSRYGFIVAEGSGGVVSPLSDEENVIVLADVIAALELPVIVVARAGRGTINHTMLTVAYLRQQGIEVCGIILNRFREEKPEHADNHRMIERLTGLPILARVAPDAKEISLAEDVFQ